MRKAEMVESLPRPPALNFISPLALLPSLTLILKLPTGDIMNPDKDTVRNTDAALILSTDDAITVVPSEIWKRNRAAADVSVTVTWPDTHQVPAVPCAILGPGK
jgi:hypothetical protein